MENKPFRFCESSYNLHMMPIGYLMIEHRLIERMVRLMINQLRNIEEKKVNLDFIDMAVNFIKNYADKCHHGKEEDILFRELAKKNLSAEHKKIMDELIHEHKMGRAAVGKLVEAKAKYASGEQSASKDIKSQIKWLIEFYPKHIVKEDKRFFIPSMSYFSKDEQNKMLSEFCQFDGSSIQETFRKLIEKLEKSQKD
jgi:hemerythrin-like domain-containing protein